MNYFQILNKALDYYINEPLEKEVFVEWGIILDEDEELLLFKETAQKEKIYLFLKELRKHTFLIPANEYLYKELNNELASVYIDKEKTIEKAYKYAKKELEDDLFYMDAKCILEDEESRTNYSKTALEKLQEYKNQEETKKVKEYISMGNIEKKIAFTPIENMIYDVITILPELFFTKNGYAYLPFHYQIEEDYVRKYCYEYVKYNISNFCWENQCMHDKKAIVYAMKLIHLVTTLANAKRYEELENLMKIDEALEREDGPFVSLLSIIYKIDNTFPLDQEVDYDINSYDTLLFLLNDEKLHKKISNEEIATILLTKFNNEDNEEQIKTYFSGLIKEEKSTIKASKEKMKIKNNKEIK